MFSSRLCIILVMTSLAQCFEIFIRAIFYDLVHVCDGQHNIYVLACLGIETVCVVLNSTELAPVIGSLQYSCPYVLPVFRVAILVFGFNRHNSISLLCYQKAYIPIIHSFLALQPLSSFGYCATYCSLPNHFVSWGYESNLTDRNFHSISQECGKVFYAPYCDILP